MTRRISIFGATGSIGENLFSLLDQLDDAYEIEVISGHNNVEMMIMLALKFRPKLVVSGLDLHYHALRQALPDEIEVAAGREALYEAASREVDWCLNAVIGAAGLPISLAAAKGAKMLALANKESMVCGGALLRAECLKNDCTLIPVDSEHSAIFQCLLGQDVKALRGITLTASGGPFRDWSIDQMRAARLEDALKHPNWDMGARITIDSASMFNKALEMIEAKELFDLEPGAIDVLVHPQSIIHSLVEFSDGGQLAQLGMPDMKHAISYALGFPKRLEYPAEGLNLAQLSKLDFEAPDEKRFPALRLARYAMEKGGVMPTALNAAKEITLDRFIAGEIGFLDMAAIVEEVMEEGDWQSAPESLSVIMDADRQARSLAEISNARY